MIVDKRKGDVNMSKVVGRLEDWTTTLFVEQGWNYTHLRLDYKGRELEIELDRKKVEELIKLLEKAIR